MRHAFASLALSASTLCGGVACVQRVDVGSIEDTEVIAGGAGGQGGGSGGDTTGGAPTVMLERFPTRVACSTAGTCAINSAGGATCWGNNTAGELGTSNEGLSFSSTPVPVTGFSAGTAAISAGGAAVCGLRVSGPVSCWGQAIYGEFNGRFVQAQSYFPFELPYLGQDVVQVALGPAWGCALTTTGQAKCWGFGNGGVLGNGSSDDRYLPQDVTDIAGERYVDLGAASFGFHTCGATSAGGVFCWGINTYGQLGSVGPDQNVPTPVAIDSAQQVALGSNHTCARTDDAVLCWGDNSGGQLGSAGAAGPAAVPGLPAATTIAAGGEETCIIADTGAVWCWGRPEPESAPKGPHQQVPADFGAIGIARGQGHGCAINAGSVVRCWGSNDRGQTAGGEVML